MAEYLIEVGLAWRSSVGKVVGTFLGRVLTPKQENQASSYQVEITELRHCWYTTQDETAGTSFNSPLLTSLEQMPEPLISEVQAFLGKLIEIPGSLQQPSLSSEAQRENRPVITLYVDNPLT